jgi:hypothetical protein
MLSVLLNFSAVQDESEPVSVYESSRCLIHFSVTSGQKRGERHIACDSSTFSPGGEWPDSLHPHSHLYLYSVAFDRLYLSIWPWSCTQHADAGAGDGGRAALWTSALDLTALWLASLLSLSQAPQPSAPFEVRIESSVCRQSPECLIDSQ